MTVTSVNNFLQALVTKRLYEELASGDLLWHVVGYLGVFENKLRSGQTYWGVPLMEDASGGAESLKLTIPKYVITRLLAIPVLRVRGVSVCHGTSAPGRTVNHERTPPGDIHLADAEVRCWESQPIS
jgi:hypothetical protein